MTLFAQTQAMTDFVSTSQDGYLDKIRTGADAADWRDFVKRTYGDAWALSTMGFRV